MKTTRLISSTLLASTLLLTGAVAISAAEGEDSVNTNAKIEFTTEDENGGGGPVDPEDPDKPVTPGGEGGSTKGPLRITYVPNLSFGKQKVSGSTKTYNAVASKVEKNEDGLVVDGRHFVQVADERGEETPSGWNLTVQRDEFKQNENGLILTGAKLNFAKDKEFDYTNEGSKDITRADVEVKNGEASLVMNAPKETGDFFNSTAYGKTDGVTGEGTEESPKTTDGVQLTVPGGSMKAGEYTSTLTWTLANTPAANVGE